MEIAIGLLIGVLSGALSGLFGIGGGVLIVPACIYVLGFSQHRAQGTSLIALLAPVGILGVMNYSKAGNIDWKIGSLIAAGFVGGAYLGSRFSLSLNEDTLRKSFAVFLAILSIQLFLKK